MSEGEALPDQRNTGDATDDRNRWIHNKGEIGLNAGAADDAPVCGSPPNSRDRWRQPGVFINRLDEQMF